ncbi:MAG: fibronectin type III domain-containing protein, partial [Chloroflexota bacterium]|nr:fibronectin type III domain-containing protein [Chloroflexota bacterium]
MTWTAVAGATGYEYFRHLPDDKDSGQTDASTTSVKITGLEPGKFYGYSVRTIVNGQKSTGSNVASQWTSPIAPRNLRAICVAGTVVQLVWSDSPGAGSYEVKIGSGSWQSRSGSRSRIFSQLALNTAYTFYVRALISADPNFSLLEALSAESSVAVTTQAAHVDPPTNLQTSEITSSGIKLTWEASPTSGVTSYEVSANGGAWVDSGGDLEHSFTGLDPDTSYRLRARAKTSAANSCSASATAVSTLPDPPAAPTSASIDYLDSTQTAIILAWTKAEGATDYQVNGGALTEWTSVGDVATYTFAGLTADTEYTVQLRASNSGGTSAAVQATGRTLPNAPAAPADLAVSARTQTTITITWTKSAGADSYEAYGGTKKLPTVNDIGDVATYTFSGLTADTQYTLQVRALNDGGYSSNAQVVTRTLPNAPAAPTALKTSGITQTGVTLTWTKSTGATGYKVRKDSGDSWTVLGDVATYSFTGLIGGTSYDLELRASNAGGDSAVEDITVLTLPAPPTDLATSGITESGITLTWTKSTGATGYKVQADAGTVVTLGDVATHSFASLSAGTSYTLKVIATNASGDSTAATITAVTLPAAPTALKTSGITHNSVTLTWTKSTGATGYKVQANAGAVTTLGDVATYSFSSLASGTSHTLKVSATNASGDSAAATITALTLPAAPTGLTTSGITKTGITLTWTKSTGATAYKVRKDSGDSWTVLGDVATYAFTGLTADTE